jgi:hypothetical protein
VDNLGDRIETAPPLADVAALTKVRVALGRLACVTCSVDGTHRRVITTSGIPPYGEKTPAKER